MKTFSVSACSAARKATPVARRAPGASPACDAQSAPSSGDPKCGWTFVLVRIGCGCQHPQLLSVSWLVDRMILFRVGGLDSGSAGNSSPDRRSRSTRKLPSGDADRVPARQSREQRGGATQSPPAPFPVLRDAHRPSQVARSAFAYSSGDQFGLKRVARLSSSAVRRKRRGVGANRTHGRTRSRVRLRSTSILRRRPLLLRAQLLRHDAIDSATSAASRHHRLRTDRAALCRQLRCRNLRQ